MTKRFFDADVRPPRGGWSYEYDGQLLTAYSESDVLDQVRRIQQNNGTFVSDAAITAAMWDYYCQREPDRCGMPAAIPPAELAPDGVILQPREITPEVQGPPIWLFLNTLAVQWTPGLHDYFLATCDAIIVMLECPECREEWRRLLADDPPLGLNSRLAVCQWVNRLHNAVNARKGRQEFPYWKMVTQFGAPLP